MLVINLPPYHEIFPILEDLRHPNTYNCQMMAKIGRGAWASLAPPWIPGTSTTLEKRTHAENGSLLVCKERRDSLMASKWAAAALSFNGKWSYFFPQQLVLTSFSLHHIQKNQLIASDVAPRVGVDIKSYLHSQNIQGQFCLALVENSKIFR